MDFYGRAGALGSVAFLPGASLSGTVGAGGAAFLTGTSCGRIGGRGGGFGGGGNFWLTTFTDFK